MVSLLKLMIKKEPDLVKVRFLDFNNSVLHVAASTGCVKMVKFLLGLENINRDSLNQMGCTPFQQAYEDGLTDICELFRSDGQETEAFLQEQIQQPFVGDALAFKQVVIHLDLKGSPPTFDFLLRFLRFLGAHFKNLITGILIEFEDMFPFTGFLQDIASPNCYSRKQIQDLVKVCKELGFKISVLIQTFGHLEFVLKHQRFSEYREQQENPISLCSLHKGSLDLVMQMVSQVVDLIEAKNIWHLHIGADEVFNYSTCKACKLFVQQAGKSALFTRWVRKVIKAVLRKYSTLQVMAWDDMFRTWPVQDLMALQINGQHRFQPCIWVYSGVREHLDGSITD